MIDVNTQKHFFAFQSILKANGNDNIYCPSCNGRHLRVILDHRKAILQCTQCFYEVYYNSLESARNIRT